MKPATWPRDDAMAERLLVIDRARGTYDDASVRALPSLLRRGDVLVLNDAATLPASIPARDDAGCLRELRIASVGRDGALWIVLFGEGDWRTPTEHRPAPGAYGVGRRFEIGALHAHVAEVSTVSTRLVRLAFDEPRDVVWTELYRLGKPIQYAYLAGELRLFHVQNRYASRPWAVEMPSAGHALTWSLLLALRERGVAIARLTHGAGLSSTGDEALDRALPLPEPYDIPAATVGAIREARAGGGRIIAGGTSVARALEDSAARFGTVRSGESEAEIRLSAGRPLRVVDGLLTGMHELDASHFSLLRAFVDETLLERAYAHARDAGYWGHEFGDANLIL